ncbi:plant disease resistance polyprotein-like [Oryza sativa Japonica Group]|uniref:Plant disease resistance polyprotein-like n=1 Tax=Oryza sativa subsp. japonica TaxID=39947 RepID=Q5SN06_ORYSJ|nr:plant disease resistance polyprotein-like [Oryza sativa Japonica Group]BAD72398.1 plant disease resistance polyprotein-like [Oryza sativa Japonica Group]
MDHGDRKPWPNAAVEVVLTRVRGNEGSGDEPRRRRGGRGGSRPREPDGGDGVVRRLAAAGAAKMAAAKGCTARERWEARESAAKWGKSERERRRCLNRGRGNRTWPGEAGIAGRRGEWGRRERRDSIFESRPSRARARAGERGEWARETRRTRGRGRRGPEEAETWARRRLRRRRRERDRREVGEGPDRWAPPVGDPGEEGGGRPGWASACGRPSKGEGRKEGIGRRPIRKKEEKGREKKKKKEKGFSLELKYFLLNFNWLKLFLEL